MLRRLSTLLALAAMIFVIGQTVAADGDLTQNLKSGSVQLKSAGPLAFAPQGILLVGDPAAATVYAIDTGDRTATKSTDLPAVEGLDEKIASLLGTESRGIRIQDLAVNPISGNTYLSVARGAGPTAQPVLLKLSREGNLSEFSTDNVKFAGATIPNAIEGKSRQEAITHLAYLNGRVLVAGLSNEDFASNLRSIPFPFNKVDRGSSVKIYHGAHGKFETKSPIRVFTTYKIANEDHVLAAYTCTPLVKLPANQLKPGENLVATTVAELGNRNRPLSMIVYNKDGKDFVLMANSSRGVMKIPLDGVDKIEGITSRISGTAGLKYDTIKELSGVQKLDALDKSHAVLLVVADNGRMSIKTVELP